ncbi:MAG: chromosomal replication initiator protein DnaA, partial [Chthoniobacter sp. 12-60-6]
IITVPNPIHQLWIESNHTAAVTDAVAEVTGVPAIIEFHVATEPTPVSYAPLPELKAARVNAGDQAPIRFFSEAGLNAKFNFDSYVIGPNSSYSVAVAKAVAEKPGRIYNPLFFYGATGLGKTHLLQAIGQEVLARKPRANVRYVTSEQFTNEFVDAIKRQTFSQFRQKYRKVDVLLIDDVQFFEGKDSTQEEFFHTFNELFNNAKQIVLASDRPPSEIKNLESRLVSRFEWGLATQIQVPDFETRIAILRRKQSDFNVSLDSWILDFMAQRIRVNVRKLEGALMRVAAHVSLEGAVTTESALATMLHDVIDEDPSKTVTVDRIQRIIATHYDLRVSDLTGPRRPKN